MPGGRRSMDYVKIPGTGLSPSRIGLGTWAIGGWMWGGTDEERSIRTICAALERWVRNSWRHRPARSSWRVRGT